MTIGTHIKNFSLFVDGRGYAGEVEEVNLPKITKKMEEFRAGGMDAPVEIDMGLEKLEADFQLSGTQSDIMRLFGVTDNSGVAFVLRAAVSDETGQITPHIATMRGTIKGIEPATYKAGDKGNMKVMLSLTYYAFNIGFDRVIEIDIPNMIRNFGGVDVLKLVRLAIGV